MNPVLPAVPARAITINFGADQQYSTKGGEGGAGNLKGQPASKDPANAPTQWTGGVSGKEASIVITANDGVSGTDQAAQIQVGTAAANHAEYTFSPNDKDLSGAFNSASSTVYYSFQLKMPSVAAAYGTNILRIRIGGPYDGKSALCFNLSDNGAFVFTSGDGKGNGPSYFAKTATGGTTLFYPDPTIYFTVSGALNYATKTFTVSVNGVPQADNGNANFHFRSDEASTCGFTLINFSADNPHWVATSIANVALSLAPLSAPPPSLTASDATVEGKNLIKNPSFENPPATYDWIQNNWTHNDVEFALDPDRPHSGKYSQRIAIRKVTGKMADLQFSYHDFSLKPGMPLELRFWTRGEPNMRPVKVSLRQPGPPYKVYFEAEIGLTKEWSESVFDFTLPPNLDPRSMLTYDLNEENTFWLDDVSLTPLPAQAGGMPLVGNQVKNGSFEVGRDHWYATFRTGEDSAGNQPNIVAQPAGDAPNGHNVLAFEAPPSYTVNLTSAYFHLRYGRPVSVGFWLKAPSAGRPFKVNLGQGTFPNIINEEQNFTTLNAGWNFYHAVVTPKVSNGGTYYLEFIFGRAGKYELDGVSAVEGESADPAYPVGRVDVGWGLPDKTPPGNLFSPGDAILFPLSVAIPPGAREVPLHLRLVDYRENELRKWDTNVPVDAAGHGETSVSLPSNRFGTFKVEVYAGKEAAAGKLPDTELLYSVLHQLKPPSEASDSFFGATVRLTPYNLAIAGKLGIRWVRLNPPLSTTWMSVEKPQGTFNFATQGVALAHQLGFHVLGLFTTTPWFYADGDPAKTRGAPWYESYAPANWDAWHAYVQKTATAFGPYIQAWEIWNEPNSHFLNVKPGTDKPALYVKIEQETRRALDDAGIKAFLIGNVAGGLDIPFTWDELADGGGKEVDALSFHLYIEDRGAEEKQPLLADQVAKLRSYQNRSGKVPGLWVTEGGIWLDQGRSWLESAEIPVATQTTVSDAANSVSRQLAGLKAMGITHYFDYIAAAEPSGRIDYRGECTNMVDVNGIPHAGGGTYAASVYFLEDATPLGLEVRPVDRARVTLAKFRSAKGPITVIWSRDPVTLGQVRDLDWKQASGFDLMGNPITLSPDTKLTVDPIYVIGQSSGASR